MPVHDFDYPVGNQVQKEAVVGDGQHSSLEAFDIALQPFYAPQIQVVSRLVQQ